MNSKRSKRKNSASPRGPVLRTNPPPLAPMVLELLEIAKGAGRDDVAKWILERAPELGASPVLIGHSIEIAHALLHDHATIDQVLEQIGAVLDGRVTP